MGVVEIDERAKMKTKVDELDFGLQTPQSTFWWLDTYQIWWWWGLQTPQSAFWSLTIYRSVVDGLAKMDSITKQQLLEIIYVFFGMGILYGCVNLEWVFCLGSWRLQLESWLFWMVIMTPNLTVVVWICKMLLWFC